MNQPFNLYDLYHLYKFRMAAAGIIRDILSAVEQSDRRDLTEAVRGDWWDKDHRPSGEPAVKLLKNAEKHLRVFPVKFSGSLDSIPCPGDADGEPTEESVEDRVEKLRDLVYEFADLDALKQAVACNDQALSVDWAQLCQWKLLPDIRKLLNTFPETVGQSSVLKITDLTVEDPDIVRYKGVECTKPTNISFLILKHLLKSQNNAAPLGTLKKVVWSEDDEDFGPVDSALREVRRFFKVNGISYGITRSKRLKQIRLTKIQPIGGARIQAGTSPTESRKQKSKSKKIPAKKRGPKK